MNFFLKKNIRYFASYINIEYLYLLSLFFRLREPYTYFCITLSVGFDMGHGRQLYWTTMGKH